MAPTRPSGPPQGSAARELIDSGFALENADAPFLHEGLNLADIAHVLDLLRRGLIPAPAGRDLIRLLLDVDDLELDALAVELALQPMAVPAPRSAVHRELAHLGLSPPASIVIVRAVFHRWYPFQPS